MAFDRRAALGALVGLVGLRLGRGNAAQADADPAFVAAFAPLAGNSSLPPGWVEQRVRNVPANRFEFLVEDGQAVLSFDSHASASSLLYVLPDAQRRAARVRWRWWASAYPRADGLGEKPGDDFAARVYLLFDYPLERVPIVQRLALGVARALHGEAVPAASICYVLDPRAPLETILDSPYTSRVKVIVARSVRETRRWWTEERDIARDFRRAFGDEYGPGVAPLQAIVLACDTDQAGARLQARFGEPSFSAG